MDCDLAKNCISYDWNGKDFTGTTTNTNGIGTSSVTTPVFVDEANDDFHIVSGGSAYQGGVYDYQTANNVALTDLDGVAFDTTNPSIGCYEYVASGPSVTISSPSAGNVDSSGITFSGTATTGTITSITWANNKGSSGSFSTGSLPNWSGPVPLAIGSNAITVTATDSGSNTNTANVTVTNLGKGLRPIFSGHASEAEPGIQKSHRYAATSERSIQKKAFKG